ncbi:uncharacterized protein HMPREF1541_00686 [Cyphellophora europaea CBS 101466]|uniref:CorA-like transporter domain-containing protein n=1 Tax=Cyphellophora europaea (strain CBS 101466) TaxID=1220924 RepID=W2SCQ3_CYPE1|nr:uncharacterized protein HMPREF1541_00686 [Cyphellophora europaea CBS 101466]ETN46501.1 hypothetical protein HMPREF1541_00686 [Cyphellophora europaea CBS 101466]
MSYDLRGVERGNPTGRRPWSIRPTAVYHKIDLTNGTCTWIIVKANELIKNRVNGCLGFKERTVPHSASRGISLSLKIHTLMSEWSAEGWCEYLDGLEDDLQALSRSAVSLELETRPSASASGHNLTKPLETDRGGRSAPSWASWLRHALSLHQNARQDEHTDEETESKLDDSDELPEPPPPEISAFKSPVQTSGPRFDFGDLQKVQILQEEISKSLHVINGNIEIISSVRSYYETIPSLQYIPKEITDSARLTQDMLGFMERSTGTEKTLNMYRARCEALLALVNDRKTLMTEVLQYRNMITNKLATQESIKSTKNTEKLTKEMNDLTQRTKSETVMMRVISLVTVVFLPGTFISVSRAYCVASA